MKKRVRKSRRTRRVKWRWRILAVLVLVASALLVWMDASVRSALGERQWQQPARVYARALQLRPGELLDSERLDFELRALGYTLGASDTAPGTAWRRGDAWGIHRRALAQASAEGGTERLRLQLQAGRIVSLENAAGRPLEQAQLDPLLIGSIYPRHGEDRELLRLEEVPPLLPATVLLVEDRYFYHHHGVSLRGIARAAWANLRAGRTVQGGSTISQQLVKNVLLSNTRSLWRKALEVPMALSAELHFSKSEILELYLNEVYLGQQGARAIHGMALASRHYFNRPLAELDPARIALLTGMIKGPAAYAPWRHPERARERRDLVLGLMLRHGLVSEAQYRRAVASDLGLARGSATEGSYPAYLDLVRRQLRRDYEREDLARSGLRIHTALDPLLQRRAEVALSQHLQSIDPDGEVQGSMVVTAVDSGDVVAVVGGRRAKFAGFNRALDAHRPVGSLIKPAVYLTALREPARYSLVTTLSDAPVEVTGADGSHWRPRNFDRESHGEVPLHRVLSQSWNQATARLGMELGLKKVIGTLRDLGVGRSISAVPSLLLGALEMSPLEVAAMYQTIAAQGLRSRLRTIRAITDDAGRPLARYPVRSGRTVEPGPVHLLHYGLQQVVREGTGRAVYQRLDADFDVAGKTGSTDDLRDAWFAGFSGDWLAVTWVGRDDNRPTSFTGATGALPIWSDFMASSSRKPLFFQAPPDVAWWWIAEGKLAAEHCEGARYIPFIDGSQPRARSPCRGRDSERGPVRRWFQRLFD